MALKKFSPTTPSQRNLVLVDKSALYKGGPVKKLTEGLSKTGGRNNSGHVTCLLYTSPSPRDGLLSRMPSSA